MGMNGLFWVCLDEIEDAFGRLVSAELKSLPSPDFLFVVFIRIPDSFFPLCFAKSFFFFGFSYNDLCS